MNIIDVWGTGKTADLFNDSVNALTGISIDLWGNEFRFPDSHEFSNYNPDYIVELVSNYMSKEYGFIKDSMKLFDLIEVNSPSHSKNYTSYKLSLGKAGTSLSNKILPDDYTICAPTSVSGQYRCVRIYGEEDSPSRGHVALVTTYQDDGQDFSRWSSGLLKPHGRLKDAINKYSNPQ